MSVSNTDLTIGFDPTGSGSITGAQLTQMVTGAAPYADKGLIVTTTDIAGVPDVPSVSTYAKLARYMWLRVSPLTSAVTAYVWNPSLISIISYTDAGGLPSSVSTNWMPLSNASIGAGSIQTGNIADGAVTDDKITSVNASKITGTVTDATIVKTTTTPATAGAIGGSFGTGLTILTGAVDATAIDADAVTTTKILDKNVTAAKLYGSATTSQIPVTNSTYDVTWTTKSIVSLAEPLAANLGKAPLVTAANVYGLSQIGFRGPAKNLVIKSASTIATLSSVISITADAIMLQSGTGSTGGVCVVTDVNIAADISVGPVASTTGRDFVAAPASSWYYVWVCCDTIGGTKYAIFSTSSTFPSATYVPSTAFAALVGVVAYGNGTTYKIRPFVQYDNKVFQTNCVITNSQNVTTADVWQEIATTYVAASIPTAIAKTMFGIFGGTTNNPTNIHLAGGLSITDLRGMCRCNASSAYAASPLEADWQSFLGFTATGSITFGASVAFEIPLEVGYKIWIKKSNISVTPLAAILCTGFTI